jgi:hypothetical protein
MILSCTPSLSLFISPIGFSCHDLFDCSIEIKFTFSFLFSKNGLTINEEFLKFFRMLCDIAIFGGRKQKFNAMFKLLENK